MVCLTPVDEMEELSPTYAKAVKQHEAPFESAGSWMHLPARNFGTPADPQRFREGIESIAQRLQAGEAVLLHCAEGMGRTGTAAPACSSRWALNPPRRCSASAMPARTRRMRCSRV